MNTIKGSVDQLSDEVKFIICKVIYVMLPLMDIFGAYDGHGLSPIYKRFFLNCLWYAIYTFLKYVEVIYVKQNIIDSGTSDVP